MAKFLLVSGCGDGIALAHKLQLEGHSCPFYLGDPNGPNLYKGILPRVADWRKAIDDDTVVIFDMVKMGEEADKLRKAGIKVVGGSRIADQLELDRGFGLDVAGNHGIEVPYSEDFHDFAKALKFLEGQEDDAGWVFKADGNKEGVNTFVSANREQMVAMLEHYGEISTGALKFILQKIVPGVEISSEVWCIDGQIVPNTYNNTLEQKRFLNHDLGPNTGCMGSTVKFNLCPRLYDETFAKLAPWIKQVKYSGPLDINCIISDGVPYMLEFTARMGYSAIYAFAEVLGQPLGDFLAAMAGDEIPEVTPSDEWAGALRLTMPPYPHQEDAPQTEGLPILGLPLDSPHHWPLDVMANGDKLACSGFDGIVCEVTGANRYLDALWTDLYAEARQIKIPEGQYRTDNHDDVEDRVGELEAVGYVESANV